jgi:hypothetical protein
VLEKIYGFLVGIPITSPHPSRKSLYPMIIKFPYLFSPAKEASEISEMP